jgi:hypothetical protein
MDTSHEDLRAYLYAYILSVAHALLAKYLLEGKTCWI